MDVPSVAVRLQRAINRHDLDEIAACFEPEYDSDQPVHPSRSFKGREQMRRNWTQILDGLPDLRAELKGWAVREDEVWTEWQWSGTRKDGSQSVLRGVTIQSMRDGLISRVRFYMEPVEEAGQGLEKAISDQVRGRSAA